jgi:hypothetical protein
MALREWLGISPPAGQRVAKHLLLTRYNIEFHWKYPDGKTGLDPAYLNPRGELFRRFCVPSVQSQTSKDFEWLVLFHPDTPPVHYEFLKGTATVILARNLRKASEIIARDHLCAGPILSTRMDNDDCIAPDFISATRETADREMERPSFWRRDFVVTPQRGAVASLTERVWRPQFRKSPSYISLLWTPRSGKPWRSPLHVHHGNHRYRLVKVDHEGPLWLSMIHGQNLRRRWKTDPSDRDLPTAAAYFPALKGV